ncbi:BZ3500_MvSof-1268-A1-R1_Chr3-1g05979 [Microbotryum saponariae]|uniref:Mitochondrial pyruvate carrier n=1 Tax=Microbotryum saponariae TaxID=289078 RepID=A0A2X0N3Z6_9BASI|nr:BZ3500_MvSof-1268-A1-R1_Chr3-1g05979 [Microbotryum saponariae]SDA05169.1 BZ3501_MvSof-1269-A2-R1_Chr3-1g05649 [Microbotryum saponariae]
MAAPATAPAASKLQALWNHPAGPKTVFFWAPMFKWGLVAAGLKDLSRPAEKISIPQNLALTATGLIWVRYSFVITPVNYSLAAVNAFVGATGIASLSRALASVLPHETKISEGWNLIRIFCFGWLRWKYMTPEEQMKVRAERAAQEAKNAALKLKDQAVDKIKA